MLDVRTKEYSRIMVKHFPKAKIEEQLRAWWKRKVASPLRRRTADPKKAGGTVFDIQPEVSSVETVEVCLEVEPLMGFEIKSSRVIRRGGYRTCDDFIQHLLPRLEAEFNKYYAITLEIAVKPSGGMRIHAN
jgi:hypothetical protein